MLRRRCRGNQGDKLSLQFFLPARVGGDKNKPGGWEAGWGALRGRRKKQELLTDNERGHQGIVLVGVYSFMHEPADVKI